MRMLLILLFLISLAVPLPGQEITDEFIGSLYSHHDQLVYEFTGVRRINYALKCVGGLDTVAYHRKGDELVYSYEGQKLNDPFGRASKDRPVRIWSYNGHGRWSVEMHVIKMMEDGGKEEFVIETVSNQEYDKFTYSYYINDISAGHYLELTPYGETLVDGNYTQIDSIWQDTIPLVNPETYEVSDSLVVRHKFPLKTGRWLYYGEQGDTLRIELYPEID
jgi:hypothetical protein